VVAMFRRGPNALPLGLGAPCLMSAAVFFRTAFCGLPRPFEIPSLRFSGVRLHEDTVSSSDKAVLAFPKTLGGR